MSELGCPKCGKPSVVVRPLLGGFWQVRCLEHGLVLHEGRKMIVYDQPEPTRTAEEERDAAMERVDDPAWRSFAMQAIDAVAARCEQFTSEDVWAELDRWQIPRPREGRVMGPAMMAAIKSGSIVRIGHSTAVNPKHHANPKYVYRRA